MKIVSRTNIPKDIRYLINRLEVVKRFDNPSYPPNVFKDNTKRHTLRLVESANVLDISKIDKRKLIRMLYIHDLPEIRYGDVTVIDKFSSQNTLRSVLDGEERVAKQILSENDFKLFQDFQTAYKFLSSVINSSNNLNCVAILANILDRKDGNVFYHKNLTKWIKSVYFNKDQIPPVKSITNSYINDRLYLRKLKKIKGQIDEKYYVLFIRLLRDKELEIQHFWKDVPISKISTEISVFYNIN